MKYYLYYLGIINLAGFIYYGIDKMLAKGKSKNRISEAWLLLLGLVGGSLGNILGMHMFRHKTKKIKFYLVNFLSLVIWTFFSIMCFINR